MSISVAAGVGIWTNWAASARQNLQAGTSTGQDSSGETKSLEKNADPVDAFTELMKGTPEQRMFKAWLARHHMSQDQYDALSAEEKKKLGESFRKELKDSLKGGIEAPNSVDIVV